MFSSLSYLLQKSIMKPILKAYPILFIVFITALALISSCSKETSSGNKRADTYKDLQYGSNTDISGNKVDLKLDVYVPKNASSAQTFPLILYVHGGGFFDGDKSEGSTLMLKFVDSGYVAVSINYRLGDASAAGNVCDGDTIQKKYTAYMAVQDTRAALRYMVANAEAYHIDVSKIFLSGNSAGAITVLNTTYLSQSDYEKILPGVEATYGGLDNSSNNLTNTFTVRGIAANSGCLPDPGYITSANVVPMILFHGANDNVIPVDKGYTHNCNNSEFVYGSNSLYNTANALGAPVVAHIDLSGEHLPYNSDFTSVNESCFFRSVLNKVTESGYYTGNESSCN